MAVGSSEALHICTAMCAIGMGRMQGNTLFGVVLVATSRTQSARDVEAMTDRLARRSVLVRRPAPFGG